jgi:hypothetical protein
MATIANTTSRFHNLPDAALGVRFKAMRGRSGPD